MNVGGDLGLKYKIDGKLAIVIAQAIGALTMEDVTQYRKRLQADGDFNRDFSQLMDLSGVIKVELTAEQIRAIAASPLFSSRSRHAYVVKTPAMFGLVRMYGTYTEIASGRANTQVFYGRDQAMAWLLEPEGLGHDTNLHG
jgi:hypothetical protein